MGYTNTIGILVAAKNEASATFAKVAADVKLTGAEINKMGDSSAATGSMLKTGLVAGLVAVAGVAAVSIKLAGDFEASITKLATSAGESTSNLKMVSDGVLKIARDTGTSTKELADGMYKIESGGQHGADGLKVLAAAAQGAKAEGSDLAVVADAVTSVLIDYHLKANDAANVTSKLVAATAAGKMTFQDLAASMPAILPVASAAHVALSDILGDMASMTVHGMSAQQSAENLTDVIRHMQAPTAIQGKELAMLGMTTTQLADDMRNHGLSGTLQEISDKIMKLSPPGTNRVILDLKTALNGLSPAVKELGQHLFDGSMSAKEYGKAAAALDPISAKQAASFATLAGASHRIGDEQMSGSQVMQNYGQALYKATGDATGLKVALMLTGENAQTTKDAIASVSNATADASGNVKGWSEVQGTFNNKMARFDEAIKTSSISLGLVLLPVVGNVVDGIINFSNAVGAFTHQYAQQLVAALAGIAVAVSSIAIGKLVSGIYSFITAGGIATTATRILTVALALLNATTQPYLILLSILAGVLVTAGMAFSGTSSSSDKLTSALARQKQSQQDLTQADKDAKKAQEDLSHAQVDAEGAALRVEHAQINLKDAIDRYGKDSLEARDASNQLKDAQLNLKDSNQNVADKVELVNTKLDNLKARKDDMVAANKALADSANTAAGGYKNWADQIAASNKAASSGKISKSVDILFSTPGSKPLGFASGGYTGSGGENEIAGIVHKGEYVLPQDKVDQSTGLPKGSSASGSTTNNLSGNFYFSTKESVDAFFTRLDQTQRLAKLGMA